MTMGIIDSDNGNLFWRREKTAETAKSHGGDNIQSKQSTGENRAIKSCHKPEICALQVSCDMGFVNRIYFIVRRVVWEIMRIFLCEILDLYVGIVHPRRIGTIGIESHWVTDVADVAAVTDVPDVPGAS